MLAGFYESEKPDCLALVMDSREPNFRAKIYSEYKATRDRMPDDLRSQEPLLYELFAALGIPTVALGGFEADDIIGTFVTELGKNPDNSVYIVSGDKDLYQFVGENVAVYDTMKRLIARRKEAIEKFGVPPERVVDYLAIVGDSSDNIPGIPGFGPKKAEALITEFGSLESIYENLDKIPGKARETLENSREVAFLSKTLATIDVNVPVSLDLEAAKFAGRPFLTPEAEALFHRLGFKSLLPKRDVVLRDVTNLGADFHEISTASEVEALLESVKNAGGCSFAAFEEKGRFAGCSVGVEGKYAVLRAKSVALDSFIRGLLSADVEIRGFDLKADLKSVYRYLEDGKVSAEEIQGSLF
jgi:DNA polymerase-1